MRPGDGRVVSNFIVQALRGEPLTVYGDGSQTRSFCYVSDLIDGIYRLFGSSRTDPTNVGNPGEFTVQQLAEAVLRLTRSSSKIDRRPLPVGYRSGRIHRLPSLGGAHSPGRRGDRHR
jgi:nucleoside-diphosphate-sugar epimerase